MRVYEGKNKQGDLVYFEISNTFSGRKSLVKAIRNLSGAKIISTTERDDIFCRFRFGSRVFGIMEPFGDNSRFHISEEIAQKSIELTSIKEYFAKNSRK